MAGFDVSRLNDEMNRFLLELQKNMFLGCADKQSLLKGICDVLGVARIKLKKSDSGSNYFFAGDETETVYFDSAKFDDSRAHFVHEVHECIGAVDYLFYQRINDDNWTDDVRSKLDIIAKLIFTYSMNFVLARIVEFSSTHDPRFKNITNLNYVRNKVNALLVQKKLGDYAFGYFNVRNFSMVNKRVGEKEGTIVLEKYLETIASEMHGDENCCIGMLGGDNCVILYRKDDHLKMMNLLNGVEISHVTSSGILEKFVIGAYAAISIDNSDCAAFYDLMSGVSIAINDARSGKGSKVIVFDSEYKDDISKKKQIDVWFKNALLNEEFQVYYQPKVDLRNYRVKGAEALVRWVHDGTMIFPDEFIPVIEQNHTIKHLDRYMFDHVCRDIRRWLDEGREVPQISINLSRASLDVDNLVNIICDMADKHGVPRHLLQAELTESAADGATSDLENLIKGLEHEGFSTAVDDFGTGFSSLSLIRELPWEVLKIDKSLLAGAHKAGSREQKLFKAIISIARELGLECIVEGAETRADIKVIKECNCNMAQGYYFSKPLPVEAFERKLEFRKDAEPAR